MIYNLNNIKKLEITPKSILITYNDDTHLTINIPDWHLTTRNQITGEVNSQHHNSIVFHNTPIE